MAHEPTTADLVALGRRRYVPVYRPRELVLERGQVALEQVHGLLPQLGNIDTGFG